MVWHGYAYISRQSQDCIIVSGSYLQLKIGKYMVTLEMCAIIDLSTNFKAHMNIHSLTTTDSDWEVYHFLSLFKYDRQNVSLVNLYRTAVVRM